MLNPQALQLRVGVDVGSRCHSVAVGLTDGRLLEEFEIPHTAAGFQDFFARIEGHATRHPYPIAVAMEGYNGHVRPLDSLVKARGWRLFNVNNLKLARFKEPPPRATGSTRRRRWSCSNSAITCRWPAASFRKSWRRPRRTTSSSAYRGAGAAWSTNGGA